MYDCKLSPWSALPNPANFGSMNVSGVLITGGAGFIGSHLAEHFLSAGIPVICVDNFSTGMRENVEYLEREFANNKFRFVEADISIPWSSWSRNISQQAITHVFHFASPASPAHFQRLSEETLWANTLGLKEALTWADSRNARLIFASTSEVYGDPQVFPQAENYKGSVNTQGPRACYDESKRFGEALIYVHNEKKKTNHGILRIFNTYGPRMNPSDGRVVMNLMVQALRGQPLTVFGDGKQTRSFCYIDDLIQAIDLYSTGNLQMPVNIGHDQEISVLDLIQEIQQVFPEKNLQVLHSTGLLDEPVRRCPDLTRARELLSPWEPQTELREGLLRMRRWLETLSPEKLKTPPKPR